MAAAQVFETIEIDEFLTGPYLRLVTAKPSIQPLRQGPSLSQRRLERTRVLARRRRVLAGLVLASALTVLALPGHTFGATTGAGLSTDLANSSVLASGMNYIVQPGDTVESIATEMNSVNPSVARSLLIQELGSSVVVPGEHVLIP
jgi:hypothetical protein